ncbi:MAG: right-handed parallel beta-helix repeat-containing protein [Candidatus Bathyarchaeota archaeon]
MRKYAFILVLLLLVSVIGSFPQIGIVNAEVDTIVVPDDYGSIQEAIDDASDGDTVYVLEGTYHENLVVNKSISLLGENVDTTIIDGKPSEGYRIPIKIECDNVSVSGFKLLYGYSGISVGGVKYCSISGNRIAGNQHGIYLVGASYSNITENYFEQIGLSAAIRLAYSNYNLIAGNYIKECTEGIQITQSSTNNTVTENTITDCDDVAIRLQYADNNTVARNYASNSRLGTSIYVANNNTITHNSYVNNTEALPLGEWEWYAKTFGYNGSVNVINQNYYSDYNGTDTDGDGLGNTPYVMNDENQDTSPLMEPIEIEAIPEFPSWIILPLLLTVALVIGLYRKRLIKPAIRQSY